MGSRFIQGLANQIIASLGILLVTIVDKRRQQESRVEKLLSLEKLTSVGRRLNWCGRQQHIIRFGENCMALRGQRANHVLHWGYTSTGENLLFLVLEYEVSTENGELQKNSR